MTSQTAKPGRISLGSIKTGTWEDEHTVCPKANKKSVAQTIKDLNHEADHKAKERGIKEDAKRALKEEVET